MYAVEFHAPIENGVVHIPKEYQSLYKNDVLYTNKGEVMLEALNLEKISISDKFLMMEEIWKDLSEHSTANGFSPQWHYDVLSQREKKITEGEMQFSPISEVKERLKKLTHEN